MHAATLLLLLTGWQPEQHPPGFAYMQLPTETVCKLCYHQCERDREAVCAQLPMATGWRRDELLELKREADRLAAIWYAAWWVTDPKAGYETRVHCMPSGPPVIVEAYSQREEWTWRLREMIGERAFWRGELPLPLSAR